jgi:hypothetical protein
MARLKTFFPFLIKWVFNYYNLRVKIVIKKDTFPNHNRYRSKKVLKSVVSTQVPKIPCINKETIRAIRRMPKNRKFSKFLAYGFPANCISNFPPLVCSSEKIWRENGGRGRGIYPLLSLLNHSCVANTKYVAANRGEMVCVATLNIRYAVPRILHP